jgi:Protein of unknown function (DUF1097)
LGEHCCCIASEGRGHGDARVRNADENGSTGRNLWIVFDRTVSFGKMNKEEDIMDLITSLAVVIGIMGGIATWAAVTIGSPYVLIWAIFVAWGSFYHCGGKEAGLQSSAAANIWGVIIASLAFIALVSMGVTAVNAGICVGVSIVVLVLAAKAPMFAAIPASVYGYASTAALFLLGGAGYGEGAGGIVKVGAAVAVSMIIGNILGYVSEKVVGAVVKS